MSLLRPAIALLSILAAAGLLAPAAAAAHAFGARYDLPLPLGWYLAAAGMAVAISFLAVVLFMRRHSSGPAGLEFDLPEWLARSVRLALRIAGLFVLAAVIATAFLGPAEATQNLAAITVWVLWWVGFLLLSALVVELWPAVDPFRGLFLIGAAIAGRDPKRALSPLPRGAGWLAPAGLLAIAWIELVSDWSEDPRALGVMVCLYTAVALAGGAVFGMAWFRTADPLGRIFELVSRIAPLTAAGPAALRLRPPGEGLVAADAPKAGEVALIVGLIGMVLFDGLSETPAWAAILDFVSSSQTLRPLLLDLREMGVDLLKAVRSVGLVATILLFWVVYWMLAWGMRRLSGPRYSTVALAGALAGSLLPIAAAYHLSHYISYLLMAGQLAGPALSDPFALGWDLVGLRGTTIDVGVIGAEQVWWIAITALILGHSLAVVVAHRQALVLFGAARPAMRSQMPMTAAMIGLTILSLWILAQPLVVD